MSLPQDNNNTPQDSSSSGGPSSTANVNIDTQQFTSFVAALRQAFQQDYTGVSSGGIGGRSSSTPAPPPLRLREPDTYDGERNVWVIDGWTRSIERYRDLHNWDDIYTFRFASTLLRGRAEAWFQAYETGSASRVVSWAEFKTLLVNKFRPVNAEDLSRDRLYAIQQTGSIQSYVDQFMDISLLLPCSGLTAQQVANRFLSDIFFRGLKHPDLVQRIRGIPIGDRTLELVFKTALDYESAYHPDASRGAISSLQQSNIHNRGMTTNGVGGSSSSSSYVSDPMELDAIQGRRYMLSSGLKPLMGKTIVSERPFQGKCHYCQRLGHKVSQCLRKQADFKRFETRMFKHYRGNESSKQTTLSSANRNMGSRRVGFNVIENHNNASNPATVTNTVNDYDDGFSSDTVHNNNKAGNRADDSFSAYVSSSSPAENNKELLIPVLSGDNSSTQEHSLNSSLLLQNTAVVELTPIVVDPSVVFTETDSNNLDRSASLIAQEPSVAARDSLLALPAAVSSTVLPLYAATIACRDSNSRLNVHVLIDDGASENYVAPRIAKMACGQWSDVSGREVETAGGLVSTIRKAFTFNMDVQGHSSSLCAYVFDTKFDVILGRSWLKDHLPVPNWLTETWTTSCCNTASLDGITVIAPISTSTAENCNEKQLDPQCLPSNSQLFVPTTISSSGGTPSRGSLNFLISHKQAHRMIRKGKAEACLLYLKDDKLPDHFSLNVISGPSCSSSMVSNDSLAATSYWADFFMKEFPEVFQDRLPHISEITTENGGSHVIDTGDARPVNRPPFRMSPLELDELKRQLGELLSLGLIRPSSSPWGAPVLFVKKKDGTMRMCIDYRALNKVTIRNATPLPRIDECLDRLHGARYFTTLDLKSGYHQIRVNADDIPKTAFNTRYGKFEFLVLSMGLCNAPPSFQTAMNKVLDGCLDSFALVYLDDVCIFSRSISEHKKHVREVLSRFKSAGFIVNKSKCSFAQPELEFLGFRVNSQGILPSPSKIQAILDWPRPTNVQDVRQFIGLAQHYRRFCPAFSSIAAPLSELTHGTGAKKRAIIWNDQCEHSFHKLKQLLTSPPLLRLPDMDRPFRIETDASDFGVGAVLLQQDESSGSWVPIAYESKKLSRAEQKFPAQERELIGIIHALRTWRCFVDGCRGGYTVFSDHKPLLYFQSQAKPTPRLVRWMAEYESFSPCLEYKPGKENNAADTLSRNVGFLDQSQPDVPSMEPDLLYATWDQLSPAIQADWPLFYANGFDTSKLASKVLRDKLVREKDLFAVRQGRVFRKITLGKGGPNAIKKEARFIPLEDRVDLVEKYHVGYGHAGFPTMKTIFESRYWWPTMKYDLQQWLCTCPECQLNSSKTQAHQDVMHPLPVPKAFARWHLDFIGELPETISGNRWLLTAVDSLTNWPIARALPIASKEAVADFLYEEIVMRFGCPSEIITDRGANFTSGLVNEYIKRLGANHKLTSAFHPRTNSKVERYNGVIKQMLRKYVNGAFHRWDEFVPSALWASRIRKHTTTGFSPFYMVYGREPQLPGDDLQPYLSRTTRADSRTISEITSKELADLGHHRAAAEFRLKARSEIDKSKWDSAIKPISIEVGDMVLLTHEGKFGLEPRFKGPFIVTEFIEEFGTCRLETIEGKPLQSLVHVDRVKLANGGKPDSTWYDPTASRREVRAATKQIGVPGPDFVDPPLGADTSSSISGSSLPSVITTRPLGFGPSSSLSSNSHNDAAVIPPSLPPPAIDKMKNDTYDDAMVEENLYEYQDLVIEEDIIREPAMVVNDDREMVTAQPIVVHTIIEEGNSSPVISGERRIRGDNDDHQSMDTNLSLSDAYVSAGVSSINGSDSFSSPLSTASKGYTTVALANFSLPPVETAEQDEGVLPEAGTQISSSQSSNTNHNPNDPKPEGSVSLSKSDHDSIIVDEVIDEVLFDIIADPLTALVTNPTKSPFVQLASEFPISLRRQPLEPTLNRSPIAEHPQFFTPSQGFSFEHSAQHGFASNIHPPVDASNLEVIRSESITETTEVAPATDVNMDTLTPISPFKFNLSPTVINATTAASSFAGVRGRTLIQGEGDVATEDIPVFLENWNRNKKRKFTPTIPNRRPKRIKSHDVT